ncbi:MAG TPA: UDP-N-acetylmuramoyl-L-alanyl-D-glutamate--2,6-diaminopimelate ligase [Actinomycetota bacterium]|nr:UDP-N-acetylmuramoyl-L-alanyl-D-glutamate--2,6-diaminopimelate ligase [Actinomycetota bacterium]
MYRVLESPLLGASGAHDPPVTPIIPLRELLAALPDAEVRGDATVPISGLTYRSSEAGPHFLFFCVRGTKLDGHDFAPEAVARSAAAVLVERWLDLPGEVTQVLVSSVRRAMGPVASAFYGRPSERMVLVGITGTNGKTTTTYILEEVFRAAGFVPGVIGTTGARVDGRPVPLERTTPEAPDFHRLLADMVQRGVGAVAMEVSSHGLDQHRVGGARYACSVFTNLSQDHLDYHGTIEEYYRAKARLFTPEMSDRAAVNFDPPEGRRLVDEIGRSLPVLTYGAAEDAEFRATDVAVGPEGLQFRVDGREVRSPLRGAFNVQNCLAALAAARQVGIDDESAVRGVGTVGRIPGRFEAVDAGQPFQVLVDYAHTPDSIENVLVAARPLAGAQRVLVVLGCGGDRDRGKRSLMGEAATRLADLTVITSDNPRSEDPVSIIAEIEPGARRGGGSYIVEPDRREAIRLALYEAGPGDVVVIAGKGHETGQEFADRTIPFDDRVVAMEELERLGGRGNEPGIGS